MSCSVRKSFDLNEYDCVSFYMERIAVSIFVMELVPAFNRTMPLSCFNVLGRAQTQ